MIELASEAVEFAKGDSEGISSNAVSVCGKASAEVLAAEVLGVEERHDAGVLDKDLFCEVVELVVDSFCYQDVIDVLSNACRNNVSCSFR